MKAGFRQSMAWLHTWSGLLVGWVLFFIFLTGTVGYFDVEINRWMRPELPLATDAPPLDQAVARAEAYLRRAAPDAEQWIIALPVGRDDTRLRVAWSRGKNALEQRSFDTHTGEFAPEPAVRDTEGGYGLYRMHWKLHYLPRDSGVWIVGFCTMLMLVALLTGVIIHKRIFADFFTLRLRRGGRSWQDAHNVASVMALPFLLMITYSGFVFFLDSYMPAGVAAAYGADKRAYRTELGAREETVQRAGPATAPPLPLTSYLDAAVPYWGDGQPERIVVRYRGDINARVSLHHAGNGTILRNVGEQLEFDAASGMLLRQLSAQQSAPHRTYSALMGLHEGLFTSPILRWLYFGSSLLGCVMVATGLILWTVKRATAPESRRHFGHRLVECLNIGTVAGLPVAIAAFFWANRLLPVDLAQRSAWEFHCLFIVWALALTYPWLRPPLRAWADELWLAAGAFALLPLLSLLTTDRHLGVTVVARDWALAGVDLAMLAAAVVFAVTARFVHGQAKGDARRQLQPLAAAVGH